MDNNIIFYDPKDVIQYLTELAQNKSLVFRGFGRQQELLPNIIREKDFTNREIELLTNFKNMDCNIFLLITQSIFYLLRSTMGYRLVY